MTALGTQQSLIVIFVVALTTFFIRALPFLLFPNGKETPKYISYLGTVLPFAAIGMLIVYCVRGINPATPPYGLPELVSIAAVVFLHRLKGNTLLSVGGGTLLYMLLLQTLFS